VVNHLPSFKPMPSTFLQAEWRKLAMANYAVDPNVLQPYLPKGVELDFWNGTCYASLIGFMFLNTKLKGIKIPFHNNFEEVNLRFYVRYNEQGIWKRGVVFIKEIVPKSALTFVANTLYNEKYETMPMNHSWASTPDSLSVVYRWKKSRWNSFEVTTETQAEPILEGSEEEFITEHYWGYTKINDRITSEYGVEHPRWKVYGVKSYSIDVDFANVYGNDFAFLKNENPTSVFLAEGSEIEVKVGRKI
jgi:uncharacterized protein YqjF (DUF2071 family)